MKMPIWSFSCGAFPGMLASPTPPAPIAMPKKYRVVSQAAPLAGKTKLDVHKALLKMNIKPEQVQLLMTKPLVIKKGLDNPKALEYAERFSAAGLKVKIEAYEVAPPQEITDTNKQKEELYNQLLQTFTQPVQPTRPTRDYQRTLSRVLLAATAAPLIYAGTVLLTVLGLVWYFGSLHGALFGDIEWRGKFMWTLWVLTYLLPAVVGGLLLVFLLYPLWPRDNRPRPHVLDPKKHARFYHLVNQMTAAMEVPAPEFIEITPEVNAAAGPVHGIYSLAKGELRLVIGLSLVAGMTVQQFIGVLAHEFGHFSQRSSMIANIWVNTINRWLAECAYGQDEWFERFDRWREQYDFEVVHISLTAAEMMIGLVRQLFARLCDLNIRITHAMSRQMEFDADLYETRLIGSKNFRSSTLQLRRLAYAESEAHFFNRLALHQKDQLLRNLPAAVVEIANGFDAEMLRRIEEDLHNQQTRYWDTHPADQERIQNAEEAGDAGMLTCDLPARLLFNDFDKLCETITLSHYLRQDIFGAEQFLLDNAQVLNNKEELLRQHKIESIHDSDRAPVNADGTIDWTPGGR